MMITATLAKNAEEQCGQAPPSLTILPLPRKALAPAQPDGFSVTLKACQRLGLDLRMADLSVLRMFYTSGICFPATLEDMSLEERQIWRDSILAQNKV